MPQLLLGLTIKLLLHAIRHAGLFPQFISPADDIHPHRIFHLVLLATAPLRNKEEALLVRGCANPPRPQRSEESPGFEGCSKGLVPRLKFVEESGTGQTGIKASRDNNRSEYVQ
jgi:hypothetical protein